MMGVAAYYRGSLAIQSQMARDYPARDSAFLVLERLNALSKHDDCGVPFGDLVFEFDQRRRLWWVMDSVDLHGGWSFCYSSLAEAVKRWSVDVVACDVSTGRFLGKPRV